MPPLLLLALPSRQLWHCGISAAPHCWFPPTPSVLLQDSDAVLALRSKVKSGGWLRLAAKHAGVPVFSVKRGDQLENALRTLLGIYPAPGGAVLRPSAQQDTTDNASTEALLDIHSTSRAASGGRNPVVLPGSLSGSHVMLRCCIAAISP